MIFLGVLVGALIGGLAVYIRLRHIDIAATIEYEKAAAKMNHAVVLHKSVTEAYSKMVQMIDENESVVVVMSEDSEELLPMLRGDAVLYLERRTERVNCSNVSCDDGRYCVK